MKETERLIAGNQRYVAGNALGDFSEKRRVKNADKQSPYAVIVACSDSRVVPEAVFGAGLGELFVVRTAGNVIGQSEAASVLYATDHLGAELVVVLGHTGCGAVAAALAGAHGLVQKITDEIRLAIGKETDPTEAAIKNVRMGVVRLKRVLPEHVKIMGAMYDIRTGEVTFLSDQVRE